MRFLSKVILWKLKKDNLILDISVLLIILLKINRKETKEKNR